MWARGVPPAWSGLFESNQLAKGTAASSEVGDLHSGLITHASPGHEQSRAGELNHAESLNVYAVHRRGQPLTPTDHNVGTYTSGQPER